MNEKQEHTPGPWTVHGDETQQAHYVHGANRVCDMVRPSGFYRSPAETEANACLIAAAPDLLAALLELLDADAWSQVERMSKDDIRRELRARAAIARAEGGQP